MRVLGIETSCDDTSLALVESGRRVLASRISSQVATHSPYGGVVPELAARDHLSALPGMLAPMLAEAGASLSGVDGVAAVYGPGLLGSLLVGLAAGKALALGLGRPFLGVNHLQAHLFANFIHTPDLEFPFLGLVVSGGHTLLLDVPGPGEFRVLGRTIDDAAGEVLDKIARLAGLPFPGGKYVEQQAATGDPKAVALPRPVARTRPLDFSFSGLKTAAALALERGGHSLPDLMASLQQAVIDCIAVRVEKALRSTGRRRLAMAGGVTANRRLLQELERKAGAQGVRVYCPPPLLCTDNAAMVASLAYFRLARGERSPLDLNASAQLAPDVA
ncbi:MAG: tRNA (adenosine(37)-N6)-threonylcarbamoyltransferase complex transferase subunit TsaD [Candidatus Wallbacteria bacterium]|nr:tRNA (adenosine(37)-N6)-threonylcarbamoyltransferase complex transferase subunit TsaD [Candidatus Wallbacteria bacterium]